MPEAIPSSPGPRSVNVRFVSNSATYPSPISGVTQVAARFGGVWEVEYSMPPLTRKQAGEWLGLLTKLNGGEDTVYIGPHCPRPVDYYDAGRPIGHPHATSLSLNFVTGEYALRWVTTPTPLINGGSQTGTSLVTDGWSEGDGLNAGDYICFENGTFRELHVVTAPCFADSNGDMTIPIAPRIRRSPTDNVAVTIVNATGEFLPADAAQAAEQFAGHQGTRSITAKFRERLL